MPTRAPRDPRATTHVKGFSGPKPTTTGEDGATRWPLEGDRVIGDGGNVTVYERPDESRYALTPSGKGREMDADAPIFGRARFDSRAKATGRWEGSRSESIDPPVEQMGTGHRARRHTSGMRGSR